MILARIEIPPVTGCGKLDADRIIHDLHRIIPSEGHAGLAGFQRQFEQSPDAGFAEIFHFRQFDFVHPAFQCDDVIGTFAVRLLHAEIIGPRRRGVHFRTQFQRTGIHSAGAVLNHRIHFHDRRVLSRTPYRKTGEFPEVLRFHEFAHQRTPGGKFPDRHPRPRDVQPPVGFPFCIARHIKRAERESQLCQPVILAVKYLRFPERLVRVGADYARFAVEHRMAKVSGSYDKLVELVGQTGRSQKNLHGIGAPQTGRRFRLAELIHLAFSAKNAQIQIVPVRRDLEEGLFRRIGFPAGFEPFEVRLFRHVFPARAVRVAVQRRRRFHDLDLCRKSQCGDEKSSCEERFHISLSIITDRKSGHGCENHRFSQP